jgi:DNA-binding NarL/FixJ family response regulator
MFERWHTYECIDQLLNRQKTASVLTSDREKRDKVRIAVIDDQPFAPEQNLRNAGFRVDSIGDIKSLDELELYQIVLCDLQGVGAHFESKYQGGFIINEIKRNYPEKFVVAYTGGSLDPAVVSYAQSFADDFIKKDADIDEWRDKLDDVIRLLSNPIEIWRRQRDALVDADVNTLEILKLEDVFVRSIKRSDSQPYVYYVNSPKLNKDIRAIGQSLIASGIFKLLFGP